MAQWVAVAAPQEVPEEGPGPAQQPRSCLIGHFSAYLLQLVLFKDLTEIICFSCTVLQLLCRFALCV